jgi:hypothetical protein
MNKDELEQYHAFLGLRDINSKSLELAVILSNVAPHPDDSPHMIVVNWLRANWPKIIAAAELDHIMSTARATVEKIEDAGGIRKAGAVQ